MFGKEIADGTVFVIVANRGIVHVPIHRVFVVTRPITRQGSIKIGFAS
jgi:hypothetical protein